MRILDFKKDFSMLNKDLIYFDNGATSFKPNCVITAMNNYYENYSANAHRGDYGISLKVDMAYEDVRDKVQKFIGANTREEIIFTSGATESLNMIANGFFKGILEPGDEILITDAEHASNVLPWFRLANEIGVVVNYIPLDSTFHVTLDAVKRSITPKTKLIALAEVTNVLGDVRPMKDICELAHRNGIFVVCDGAQSVPHKKCNVKV